MCVGEQSGFERVDEKLAIYEPPDDDLPYSVLSIDKKGYDVLRVDNRWPISR